MCLCLVNTCHHLVVVVVVTLRMVVLNEMKVPRLLLYMVCVCVCVCVQGIVVGLGPAAWVKNRKPVLW